MINHFRTRSRVWTRFMWDKTNTYTYIQPGFVDIPMEMGRKCIQCKTTHDRHAAPGSETYVTYRQFGLNAYRYTIVWPIDLYDLAKFNSHERTIPIYAIQSDSEYGYPSVLLNTKSEHLHKCNWLNKLYILLPNTRPHSLVRLTISFLDTICLYSRSPPVNKLFHLSSAMVSLVML